MLESEVDNLLLKDIVSQEILIGLKVDKDFSSFDSKEWLTEGIDGLEARLKNCKAKGCSFVKWRCIFKLGENLPSSTVLELNCNSIAR